MRLKIVPAARPQDTPRAIVREIDGAVLLNPEIDRVDSAAPTVAAPADGKGMRRGRAIARTILALAYFAAGLLHVFRPVPFVLITPDWVPFPHQVIVLTGLCEIAGAVALFTGRLRRAAGIALALYAICVYPANVKHAFEHVAVGSVQLGWWYHAPRLALQPVLVWWALFAGGVVTWPFRRYAARRPSVLP